MCAHPSRHKCLSTPAPRGAVTTASRRLFVPLLKSRNQWATLPALKRIEPHLNRARESVRQQGLARDIVPTLSQALSIFAQDGEGARRAGGADTREHPARPRRRKCGMPPGSLPTRMHRVTLRERMPLNLTRGEWDCSSLNFCCARTVAQGGVRASAALRSQRHDGPSIAMSKTQCHCG